MLNLVPPNSETDLELLRRFVKSKLECTDKELDELVIDFLRENNDVKEYK